jgi:hypothetical protein
LSYPSRTPILFKESGLKKWADRVSRKPCLGVRFMPLKNGFIWNLSVVGEMALFEGAVYADEQ